MIQGKKYYVFFVFSLYIFLVPVTESGAVLAGFLQKVSSLTYDGVALNFAFSPDLTASGLDADERTARRAVCATYKGIEERRCFCHRAILVMEHSYDESDNVASVLLNGLIKKIYSFFDLINGSQKNEQELPRVQENDRRKKNILLDITVPKARYHTTPQDYREFATSSRTLQIWSHRPLRRLRKELIGLTRKLRVLKA